MIRLLSLILFIPLATCSASTPPYEVPTLAFPHYPMIKSEPQKEVKPIDVDGRLELIQRELERVQRALDQHVPKQGSPP